MVEDFELEAKSHIRSDHTAQVLPSNRPTVDDQQGHLLEGIRIVSDLPTDHIIPGDTKSVAVGLYVPAAKLPTDALEKLLERDEQVLFRIGDYGELVALLRPYFECLKRQLVAEDMGPELEGVGCAVNILDGQRIEIDVLVVESEVLSYGLVVTPGAQELRPLLVPDRYPVIRGNIGSTGTASLIAHRGCSVLMDTAQML